MSQAITIPDLGVQGDVEVIEVSVAVGDSVAENDTLLVLESDKASMELPAPMAGIVREILLKPGDRVRQGDSVLMLEVDAAESVAEPIAEKKVAGPEETEEKEAEENVTESKVAEEKPAPKPAPSVAKPEASAPAIFESASHDDSSIHAGPAVRKLARELGVELARVAASGPRQRVLKDDLNAYIKDMMRKAQSPTFGQASITEVALPDFSQFGEISVRALTKIQFLTAKGMLTSWQTAPQVTQFDQADITELEQFRKDQKARAESEGVKLTVLPFLLKACAYALKALPQLNVSIDMTQQQVIEKHYFHIGIAVDTPHGLFVPVVRDVDKKSILELAQEVAQLAQSAAQKKLLPSQLQGASFSISSLGSIGGTAFTPIVNVPEVAILGVSKAQMQPVFINGQFVPRLMLPLSLSYDHRAVNGAEAARFTTLLGQLLGDIRNLLL